jgi:acetate kinase
MKDAILILNAGSSSIKFAAFDAIFDAENETDQARLLTGAVTEIGSGKSGFVVADARTINSSHRKMAQKKRAVKDHAHGLQIILDWLEQEAAHLHFVAAGHRVVHGGSIFSQPICVDKAVLAQLEALIPLAPLHQPYALYAMEILLQQRPELMQVACFDTAFHSTMPEREKCFALPEKFYTEGIRRYGFHGLSYEYIVSKMPRYLAKNADGKVVIAHLGHGASMCAVYKGKSVATSMSFTPLDGLPMGTRSGAIDPAIVLYLLTQGKTTDDVSDLLNHQSGLLGLSGISGDMQTLLASLDAKAMKAVDYFCYRICRELASLAAALGGLDAVVFTGGIGEQAAEVRENVCRESSWLGIELDKKANLGNANRISTTDSQVSVWMIPTDEELVIARHTQKLFRSQTGVTTAC